MNTKLKQYLVDNKRKWTDERSGPGGCDTCGYGAEEYEVVDWDKLAAAIDAFGEELRADK